MGAVTTFISGSARLALALLVVAVLLIAGVWGFDSWQKHSKNQKEAPLALKKQWDTQTLLSSIPVNVATAWRDGQTHYQVQISEYSDEKYSRQANASITLQFHDEDGFKLWDKQVTWAEMTGLTGKDGNGIEGYSWAGNDFASADDYARAGRLAIVWRGLASKTQTNRVLEVPLPKPAAIPVIRWTKLLNWRSLAVGNGQEDVRNLLGEPTNVDQISVGYTIWRYGDIVNGGEVTFTKGAVSSWREPER